jgi:hypothetical protein
MIRLTTSISMHWQFLLFALPLALCSCQRKIPPEYEYPGGWVTAEHPSQSARNLSGVVTNGRGAPLQSVLVELMTSDFKTRLDARLTDSSGRFNFKRMHAGTHYLRLRDRGFNDYLIAVQVSPDADKSPLAVHLEVSN